MLYRTSNRVLNNGIKVIILICMDGTSQYHHHQYFLEDINMVQLIHCSLTVEYDKKEVVVVLRSPIHANEPSEYNGMLYRTSNRVLNNGIKVIILICMDGTSQYHHHQKRRMLKQSCNCLHDMIMMLMLKCAPNIDWLLRCTSKLQSGECRLSH